MELEAGNVLAQRYRIIRQLGRGGMGEVFAAENIRTGRIVAVKVLRADSKQKSSAVARFRREARAAGAINSDHVTQVLDVEEDDQHGIIIVFELLEGESLIDRLKRTGPMTFDELFPVVEQVWMGLVDAHKAGVIHRDLKPSNVFLERRPDGITRVKILDFGISKLPREVGGETLTEMGQSLGTFSFMPPEQIGKAKTVDHRADIYACATLIYQAMSGQLPYGAKNILQMVDLKTKSEPRPLASVLDGPVDPKLEGFLKKGLSRDPGDRYQSAQEALDVWRELKRTTGRSTSSSSNPAYAPNTPFQQPQTSQSAYGQQVQQQQVQQQQPQQQQPQQHQQQQPSTGQFAQPGANYPQFAGAAAAPQSFANTPQPTSSGGYPPSRSPATVMLTDPSRLAVSPLPTNYGRQTNAPGQLPPQNINPRLGGTVAMTGSTGAPINVPILNDTSSEGPDQVATLAMPMRNVSAAVAASLAAKGYGPAGTPHQGMATPQQQQSNASAPAQPTNIPRLHDDSGDRGQQGTQLMSHASLRQAGVPIPTNIRQTGRSTGLPQPDGGQGQQQQQQSAPASQVAPQSQVASSQSPSAAAQGSAEPETAVYRRETHGPRASTTGRDPNSSGVFANPVTSSGTNNPVLVTAPAPKRSNLGIILGVIAFALVGFGVAAVLLRYLQAR
ncbi:MAG: protein kinase [Polyangiaceae bacterium]